MVSDWDAVHDRVAALRAGLDLEMPGTGGRTDAEVVAAVRAGTLPEETVDASARRVLALVARAYPGPEDATGVVMALGHEPGSALSPAQLELLRADAHHALAREAAAGALTLLRNEPGPSGGAALPLAEGGAARIAVIGAFAEHARIQGGGSSGVEPTRVDVPLEAIRRIAGERVVYAPGYLHLPRTAYQDDAIALLEAHGAPELARDPRPSRRSATITRELQLAEAVRRVVSGPPSPLAVRLIDEAVAAARDADTIVVFAGLPLSFEQEAQDREALGLPADQVALLERLAELRERTGATLVVVLAHGAAVTMDPWHDRVDAILEAWLGGQAVGSAIADVLFGRVNPSGKVAETFPLALRDSPGQPHWRGERGVVLYGEGVFIGYRWYDALGREVRYPFGHGLSYTRFAYSDLEVRIEDAREASVRVRATVTNAGAVAGREVVQLYVGDPDAEVERPVRELRGFEKVTLGAGESVRVDFALSSRDFAYWDAAAVPAGGRAGAWRREGGAFRIELGASSRDIRLAADIALPDDPDLPPLVPDAALRAASASRFVDGHAG